MSYMQIRPLLEEHIEQCINARSVARTAYRGAIRAYFKEEGKNASKLATTLKAEFSKRAFVELQEFHRVCSDARLAASGVSDDIAVCHAALPRWIWEGDLWDGD